MELTISPKRKFQHKIALHVKENRKPKWLTNLLCQWKGFKKNKNKIKKQFSKYDVGGE